MHCHELSFNPFYFRLLRLRACGTNVQPCCSRDIFSQRHFFPAATNMPFKHATTWREQNSYTHPAKLQTPRLSSNVSRKTCRSKGLDSQINFNVPPCLQQTCCSNIPRLSVSSKAMQRTFYTENRLHREAFTHKELSQKESVAQTVCT